MCWVVANWQTCNVRHLRVLDDLKAALKIPSHAGRSDYNRSLHAASSNLVQPNTIDS